MQGYLPRTKRLPAWGWDRFDELGIGSVSAQTQLGRHLMVRSIRSNDTISNENVRFAIPMSPEREGPKIQIPCVQRSSREVSSQ